MMQLLRVFFPSWKFFDVHVAAPDLFYRVSVDGTAFGNWITCIPKTKDRSFSKLFINTHENFLFACHALVEYLKNDLEDGSDPTTSLELIQNLVCFQMRNDRIVAAKYQFKLAASIKSDALYLSQEMSVS